MFAITFGCIKWRDKKDEDEDEEGGAALVSETHARRGHAEIGAGLLQVATIPAFKACVESSDVAAFQSSCPTDRLVR